MWARFETIEEFETWHESIKTALGIPLPDGITTEYTEAFQVSDGSYSAWVEESEAEGLTEGIPYVKEKAWS